MTFTRLPLSICPYISLLPRAFAQAVPLTQNSATRFPATVWKVGLLFVRASHVLWLSAGVSVSPTSRSSSRAGLKG